ncbi:hypothetical protein ASG44_12155 [Methylophilus sp. Leaf459]|nr:hypothetical protein ASG34_10600 [Methylophilus sp. Leaf416]KQT58411.1 hypothetical protein ASG44_12155 [Methylophilus sp. Leaf459]
MLSSKTKDAAAQKTLNDPRWQQVLARDSQADGQFYYSVKTTGVYCRPSCGARLARPENVEFHLTTNNWDQSKLIFHTTLTQLIIDFERRSS